MQEFLISTTCTATSTRAVQTNIFFAEACYEHVSKWEECAIKAGCEPLGNGEYLCNPSDTGETGM